jgi:DNA polymerase IV
MANEVWAWCEKMKTFGRTVTVKVKYADFRQVTRRRTFSTPIARRDLLRQASVDLIRTLLPTAMSIRLLGVTISNFEQRATSDADELPLFGSGETSLRRDDASSSLSATGES